MKKSELIGTDKKFYIIGAVVLVVAVAVLYFVFSSGSKVNSDLRETKLVDIIAKDKITNVNEPGENVVVNVSGTGNKIVVSAETNVSKIIFNGENNYVHLCVNGARGAYIVEDSGIKNYVMTLDCPGD